MKDPKHIFVIAGFGRFGRIACQRIDKAFPLAQLILVDKDKDRVPTSPPPRAGVAHMDAVEYICRLMDESMEATIIPMVPFHLAARVCLQRVRGLKPMKLDKRMENRAPNHFPLDHFNACYSLADFICPDNCAEGRLCAVTGEPRTEPMYRILSGNPPFEPPTIVIRSRQILPGVGGYSLSCLRELLNDLPKGEFILATSCKCHAIVTGLKNSEAPGLPQRSGKRDEQAENK